MNIGSRLHSKRRRYRSELRAAQATSTRHRILDAVADVLKSGPESLSIAGVARAAKVSLPTVNRHFPTKRDLFEAFRLKAEGAQGAHPTNQTPPTLAGSAPMVRALFDRFDDPNDPLGGMNRLRNALAWEFSREVTVPRRQEWADQVISREFPGLSRADRARLSDLIVVLVSSSMGEALRGYLGRSGNEMADRVNWALQAFGAYAKQRSARPTSPGRAGRPGNSKSASKKGNRS